MFTCTSSSRACSLVFKCLVQPQLEYACQVWNLYLDKTFKCLRLLKSMLLGGYMLNETMIHIPGL